MAKKKGKGGQGPLASQKATPVAPSCELEFFKSKKDSKVTEDGPIKCELKG